MFQNEDGRVFFLIPYERDFTLIGTTDQDFIGDPSDVRASAAEIAYLCEATSAYLRKQVTPDMVVWTYSGVRPLYDDGSSAPQQATRDYVLKLDAPADAPPCCRSSGARSRRIGGWRRRRWRCCGRFCRRSRVGGRLDRPYPPARRRLPDGCFRAASERRGKRYPFIAEPTLRRLLRAYGTRIDRLIGDATCAALGRVFGADLTEAELRYLVEVEWARTAADVVWRRSKLGLRLSPRKSRRRRGMRRWLGGVGAE